MKEAEIGARDPLAGLTPGTAEALGVEIRVDPFQVTSWTQTVQIQ